MNGEDGRGKGIAGTNGLEPSKFTEKAKHSKSESREVEAKQGKASHSTAMQRNTKQKQMQRICFLPPAIRQHLQPSLVPTYSRIKWLFEQIRCGRICQMQELSCITC